MTNRNTTKWKQQSPHRKCWLAGVLAPDSLRRLKSLLWGLIWLCINRERTIQYVLPWSRLTVLWEIKDSGRVRFLPGINNLVTKVIRGFYLGKCWAWQNDWFQQFHSKKNNWGQGKSPRSTQKESVGIDMQCPGFEIQQSQHSLWSDRYGTQTIICTRGSTSYAKWNNCTFMAGESMEWKLNKSMQVESHSACMAVVELLQTFNTICGILTMYSFTTLLRETWKTLWEHSRRCEIAQCINTILYACVCLCAGTISVLYLCYNVDYTFFWRRDKV